MTTTNQQNMFALATSGTKRSRRAKKIAKHHKPKRRKRKRIRRIKLPRAVHRKPKVKRHYKRKRPTAFQKREARAKSWVAYVESRGRYHISNGVCYGKYQLMPSYLHGDFSPANQERTADRYVHSRYGTWQRAKIFHIAHGWY